MRFTKGIAVPVVVANLQHEVLSEIQRLVEAGQYASVAAFLELAAANQLELERDQALPDTGRSHHIDRSDVHPHRVQLQAPRLATIDRHDSSRTRQDVPVAAVRAARSSRDEGHQEALTRLRVLDGFEWPSALALCTPPPPSDGWIWGQINRFLPLKVALRWLALFGARANHWPTVDQMLESLGSDAAAVGTALERADSNSDRTRDGLLATGLPRRGNTLSVDRFLSQYLARTTRKGAVHAGAAIQYGLAQLDNDCMTLSTTGLQFALLRSPILDGDLDDAKDTLSEEERHFFVTKAVPQVATELRDFALVATVVGRGHDTPGEVTALHRERLPTSWSDTMVRTHVTGVVARMVDLGLLRRVWQGRHVQYELCPLADEVERMHLDKVEGFPNG